MNTTTDNKQLHNQAQKVSTSNLLQIKISYVISTTILVSSKEVLREDAMVKR